jgi:hypothetical protein
MTNFKKDDGAPAAPVNSAAAGAVTSDNATAKKPSQGRYRSGISKPPTKIDTNKHGIRREVTATTKKTRPKKV